MPRCSGSEQAYQELESLQSFLGSFSQLRPGSLPQAPALCPHHITTLNLSQWFLCLTPFHLLTWGKRGCSTATESPGFEALKTDLIPHPTHNLPLAHSSAPFSRSIMWLAFLWKCHAFGQAVSMARHRLPCREGSLLQEALPDCLLWVSWLLGPPLPTRGWLPPALRTLCPLGLSPVSLSERVGCGGGEIEDRCH